MRLAHADDQAPLGEDPSVGVTQGVRLAGLGRDRLWLGSSPVDAVEAAVFEVGAVDDAAVAKPRAPAVLVHASAHVEAFRRDVDRRSPVRKEDERCPSLLLRTSLEPVEPFVVDREGAVGDAAFAGNEVESDRRRPRAVRRDGGHSGRNLQHVRHHALGAERVPDAEREAREPECRRHAVE